MKLSDLVASLSLTVFSGRDFLDREVKGGYASDLLSHVMAGAAEGSVWVTMQSHQNVVAVASLTGLAAVIIVEGWEPDQAMRQKAEEEKVVLLGADLPAFEVTGRLYELGIKGVTRGG